MSGNDVPMREEPRRDAPMLDRLTRGMDVVELERRPDWVKVRHPITAREGWMSAHLVTAERPGG
ncbi:SH3 domain-containing protein, partial [Enterobacter bugandensis]|uniref:SH3 domain-containing protein n=1 Tax=Enterobacter bugandensis TaxID=881260 RepID=UPI0013D21D1B